MVATQQEVEEPAQPSSTYTSQFESKNEGIVIHEMAIDISINYKRTCVACFGISTFLLCYSYMMENSTQLKQ